MKKQWLTVILAFLCTMLLLSGCGGGSSGGGESAKSESDDSTAISGAVVKGLLQGGTVKAYAIVDGQKGDLLGSAKTSTKDGTYRIDIGSYSGPVLLEVSGGTYRDEATGTDVSLQTTLRAAIGDALGEVSTAVTPLTEIAVQLAGGTSGLNQNSIESANNMVSELLGGNGKQNLISETIPVDASTTQAASGTNDQKEYGLLLAAISQMAAMSNRPVAQLINDIVEDMRDLIMDDTGAQLNAALAIFCANAGVNRTGITTAPKTVTSAIAAISTTGLTQTGTLGEAKTRLAAFLQDTTEANYNRFMNYMNTFVAPSKEVYLFTAIARLFALYTQDDVAEILANLPDGVDLDTDFSNQTDAQIDNMIIAFITADNLDKTLAAAIAKLDLAQEELRKAEGVQTSISLTGFDTVAFDTIDVKLLQTFTLATKAALSYMQAIDLSSVTNWDVTVKDVTYNIRDLLYSPTYADIYDGLTDAQIAQAKIDFLTNNPNLFTFRASVSAAKLDTFKTLATQAVNSFDEVIDALTDLGSTGRNNRVQNAFNIFSDLDYQQMKAVNEYTLPSIIAAFGNAKAGLRFVDDERTGVRYVTQNDGYTYKQMTSNIYVGTYTRTSADHTIYGLVSGTTTPRALILADLQAELIDQDYDMYAEPAGTEAAVWWTNWTLYASNVIAIEWDNPIVAYD